MEEVVTVGLDIAKSVFQAHGVDADGQVVLQRRLTRAKLIAFFEKLARCRVGIEACATAPAIARSSPSRWPDPRIAAAEALAP